jgi:Protein of unknown function (DUF4012)
LWWFVVGALAVLAVLVGAGLALILPARGPLLEGRDRMLAGRDSLVAGDATAAADAFAAAEASFAEASGRLANPLTRLASLVPIAGRTPDAVGAGARAGVLVAGAGRAVAAAAEGLPGGVGALAPQKGTIQIEPFRRLAGPLSKARTLVARAAGILDRTPRRFVPGPVAEAVEGFDREAERALRVLTSAAAISRVMPSFLGDDGPRRYLVGAQNPAELRGTGGLVGSYAILTVDRGRFDLGRFRDVYILPQPDPSSIEPPNPDYARIYTDYLERGPWPNANMTPDFPAAATMYERIYEAVTGEPVDGMILADPLAFSRLMEVSGPEEVPGAGVTVDADNVVPFVTNQAYSVFTDASHRKRVLGSVAGAVLDRFLGAGASADPIAAGTTLVDAAADGHLLFHSAEPTVQSGLKAAGVAGALDRRGDLIGVVANNAGANKIDFYAERSVRHSVDLFTDGSSAATTRVLFQNTAPATGQPRYVIGPYEFLKGDAAPGENLMLVSAYCGTECALRRYLRDGEPEGVEIHEERGYPFVLSAVRIESGGTADLEYGWADPSAWDGDEYGGTYRLSFLGQPTIRETKVEIDIRVPPGMRVVDVSAGMRVEGDHVRWSGSAENPGPFEVEFARKLFGVL